jgi:hypothetical protein
VYGLPDWYAPLARSVCCPTQAIALAPQQSEAYYLRKLVTVLMGHASQANQEGQRAPHLHTPTR